MALGVIAVVTAVAAVAGYALLSRTDTATTRLTQDVAPARLASVQMEAALLDQETGIRGYLLTGDKDLLQPYTQGLAIEQQSAAAIRADLRDDRAVSADVAAVEAAARTWRAQVADPALKAKPPYGSSGIVDAGKPQFDRIRALLAKQSADLEAARDAQLRTLSRSRELRDTVLVGLLAVVVAICAALAFTLQRAVIRPVEAIRRAATRVAGGDLGHRIPHHGPADLRAVADAVEDMRARVVADLDASRRQEALLVAQRVEIDEQTDELQRSNADLEQFAYVASHDLQEPLRKVASFCQLLERRYADELDDRARQYIAFAVDGAKRMQVLINDLLAYSRVGRLDGPARAVDGVQPVEHALRNLAAAIEETDAEVTRPEVLPAVQGDPMLLGMLWQNLLGNAIKFRAPDRAPEVRIEGAPDPDEPGMVRFSVQDNGIGIPPEFAEKVFIIFQRLHSRDRYDGTGIGLSLCKKIVERAGGRIWLDDAPAEGTRIVFTLPAPDLARDADTASPPEGEAGRAVQP